jgi:hypothetical protein
MDNFERFGRKVDEELERLRRYLAEDLGPEAERRAATVLRKVSRKLSDLAGEMEARDAQRRQRT